MCPAFVMESRMAEQDLSRLTIDKRSASLARGRGRMKLWVALGLLVVLATAALLMFRMGSAIKVETASVTQVYPSQAFTLLNASGYVVAQRKASVAPKTTGQLEWLGVEEGSRVKSGQILARLENRDVKAGRDQASAALSAARFNREQASAELIDASRAYKRAQELIASGVVSQSDFDVAETRFKRAKASVAGLEAGVKSAEAALAGADAAVGYTVIRAPFDAVVLTKNADIGDIVTPIGAAANAKAAVVTIADLGSLQVEADVSESSLGKVKQGQPCEIQLDSLPDLRFRGAIHTIVPTADRSKATVMVKVRFIDSDPRILPEMSAKVAFLERPVTAAEQRPKTAVTPAAVRNKEGKRVVYLVKGDRLVETPVTLGDKIGDQVEVLAGIRPGDKVAVKPQEKLKDGAKIKSAEK